MENYSLSDIGAVAGGAGGFGGNSAWVLIILFAMIFGGGFGFGNKGVGCPCDVASKEDVYNTVQRSTDFAALERQNNEGVAATRQAAYDVTGAIKDANYNTLGELRDLQSATTSGFAQLQACCCEQLRAIDSVNYNGAINTASINAVTTAQTQKILDALSANRMADMQNQINRLQLQNAMCGVVRYPTASMYYAGVNPFCSTGCGCGCNNI